MQRAQGSPRITHNLDEMNPRYFDCFFYWNKADTEDRKNIALAALVSWDRSGKIVNEKNDEMLSPFVKTKNNEKLVSPQMGESGYLQRKVAKLQ